MNSASLIILATLFTVGSSLICRTCQENSCADPTGWISHTCAPDIKWCYRLMNSQDKVYRAGCSFTTCDQLPKPAGAKCEACDSDECNSAKIINANQPNIGGGVTWNSAGALTSEAKISLLSSFISFILLFLLR